MRYEPETTFDQRAQDRTRVRRMHKPGVQRDRESLDRTTIRHHREETKFVTRRAK